MWLYIPLPNTSLHNIWKYTLLARLKLNARRNGSTDSGSLNDLNPLLSKAFFILPSCSDRAPGVPS